ncbi:MAG TPA: YggT family protein [Gammaproteobacteria bacterium]|nr:YggT family protein [Gammaproteobacteria bacterium]
MSGNFENAGLFLIKSIFELYLLILMVRLILAFASANYFNPLTQFIVKLTQPLVNPLRRVIPNYRRIEFSTLVLIIVFELLKITLLFALSVGIPDFFMLLMLSVLESLKLLLKILFYAILIQAVMSWFQMADTPVTDVLRQITSPILRPLRRMVPPISGFDITPIPALIILQLCIMLLP